MAHLTYRDWSNWSAPRKVITPARDEALKLFNLLKAAMEAEAALTAAQDGVPSYTGQWEDIDFWGDEAEAFNRSVDALYEAVCTAE